MNSIHMKKRWFEENGGGNFNYIILAIIKGRITAVKKPRKKIVINRFGNPKISETPE